MSTPEEQLKPQEPQEMTLRQYVDTYGEKIGVPKPLRDSIFEQESNWNHYDGAGRVKTSLKGARGVGQLMPATARNLGVNPDDPIQNAYGSLKLQKQLYDKYLAANGDPHEAALLTAAAYNAGEGAVEKYNGIPKYKETQNYVSKVAQRLKREPITQQSSEPASTLQQPSEQTTPTVPSEMSPEGLQADEPRYVVNPQPITPERTPSQPGQAFYGLQAGEMQPPADVRYTPSKPPPGAVPASEFTSQDTYDIPLKPFDVERVGALGVIGNAGSEAQQSYLDFVRRNAQPVKGKPVSVEDAAGNEALARTYVALQDYLQNNPKAKPKEQAKVIADLGMTWLKDSETEGMQLPKLLHQAMLEAHWTPDEFRALPSSLRSQIQQRTAQAAATRKPAHPDIAKSISSGMSGEEEGFAGNPMIPVDRASIRRAEAEQERTQGIIRTEESRQGPGLRPISERLADYGISPSGIAEWRHGQNEMRKSRQARDLVDSLFQLQSGVNPLSKALDLLPDDAKTWAKELVVKGGAQMLTTAAGLIQNGIPVIAVARAFGAPDPLLKPSADFLKRAANSINRATGQIDRTVNRSELSQSIQDIGAGTLGSAPAMALIALGVPAWAAFGMQSSAQAQGQSKKFNDVVFETAKGVSLGVLFDLPIPAKASLLSRLGARMSTVGVGTFGIEKLSGAPTKDAAQSAAINAILAGAGERAGILKKGAETIAKADITPEWIRDRFAEMGGLKRGVVMDTQGRAISLYGDPQSKGVGGEEITPERAEKYAKRGVEDMPVIRVSPEQFERVKDLIKSKPPKSGENITKTITGKTEAKDASAISSNKRQPVKAEAGVERQGTEGARGGDLYREGQGWESVKPREVVAQRQPGEGDVVSEEPKGQVPVQGKNVTPEPSFDLFRGNRAVFPKMTEQQSLRDAAREGLSTWGQDETGQRVLKSNGIDVANVAAASQLSKNIEVRRAAQNILAALSPDVTEGNKAAKIDFGLKQLEGMDSVDAKIVRDAGQTIRGLITSESTPLAVKEGAQKPRTHIDLILDSAIKQGVGEVTIPIPEKNANREGIQKIIDHVESRGLSAATDGKVVLVRGLSGAKVDKAEPDQPTTHPVSKGVVETPANSGVQRVPVDQLNLDPERFQYKIQKTTKGTTGSLADVSKWNPNFAGVTAVWRDPADGRDYIVNGHNRFDLARRTGQADLDVRYIDAPNADAARAQGALMNIAEGQGSALDAGEFLRGHTPEDLKQQGVNLKRDLVAKGVALSKLNKFLFNQVAQGELPEDYAVQIGSKIENPDLQEQAFKAIKTAEAKGRVLNKGTVDEMIDAITAAPRQIETEQTLFGDIASERSLVVERAQVASALKRQLSADKSLFGTAARQSERLKEGGTVVDVAQAKQLQESAAEASGIFDTLKNRSGEISDILDEGARQVASGKRPDQVAKENYGKIKEAVSRLLGRGKEGTGKADEKPLLGAEEPKGQRSLVEGAGEAESSIEPKVLAHVAGPSGAGKTELVNKLGESVKNIDLVDLDIFDEQVVSALGWGDKPKNDYTDEMLDQVHAKRQELIDAYIEKSDKPIVFFGHHIEGENITDLPTEDRYLLNVSPTKAALNASRRPGKTAAQVKEDIAIGKKDVSELKALDYEPLSARAIYTKIKQLSEDVTRGRQTEAIQNLPPAASSGAKEATGAETPTSASGERSNIRQGSEEPARTGQPDNGTEPAKEKSKPVVFQASILPGAKEFVEHDLIPTAVKAGTHIRAVVKGLEYMLAPRRGVARDTLDAAMRMKGERDKADFILEASMKDMKKYFNGLPQDEQIAFVDRVKRGEKQPSEYLQQVADMMSNVDRKNWERAQEADIPLKWLDNHYRVLWKTVPGTEPKPGFRGVFRRPLRGSRGMMKRHTLADMSEGLAMGGVPVSYNPVTMFEMAQADLMKFITAQNLWNWGRKNKLTKWVPEGRQAPEGFVQVKDSIARRYFRGPAGMVKVGEWYTEEGYARLLNNFLSKDYLREMGGAQNPAEEAVAATGRSLLWVKNNMTAVELGLSAFHAVFESGEAISAQMGLGLRRIYNLGVLKGDPKEALKGIAALLTSPTAPATTARTGGSAIKYMANPKEFLETMRGQSFIKQFPDAEALINDLFTGGGRLAMHEDYRLNWRNRFREAIGKGNYIGAAPRGVMAANEYIMSPLFEHYIPRLKVGLFLKEYSQALAENQAELTSGKMTRAELARKTWDFVEDRFGEMNFDNLFWDRTLKTAAQITFRSVTWKLGNLRAVLGAPGEQTREAWSAAKEKRLPRLTPKAAWLASMSLLTATIGTLIMKAFTGKYPEKLYDFMYPQVDPDDDRQRVSIPTYARDEVALARQPLHYLGSSLSSELSRTAEVWANKDFYGEEVYSEDDPIYEQAWDITKHYFPLPFSVSSYLKFRGSGEPSVTQLTGFVGFPKAPAFVSMTPMDEVVSEYYKKHAEIRGKSHDEIEKMRVKHSIADKLRKGEDPSDEMDEALQSGLLKPRDLKDVEGRAKFTPRQLLFRGLPLPDALNAWEKADAKQRDDMKSILAGKLDRSKPDTFTPDILRQIAKSGMVLPSNFIAWLHRGKVEVPDDVKKQIEPLETGASKRFTRQSSEQRRERFSERTERKAVNRFLPPEARPTPSPNRRYQVTPR